MAYWPFGRKTSRRKSRNGVERSSSPDATGHYPGPEREHGTQDSGQGLDAKRTGKGGRPNRTSSRETKKLQRRAMSFSPGRNDSIKVSKDAHRQHPVPPVPQAYRTNTGVMPLSMDEKDWQRVPTLHKRSANGSPRRKSSKKRKEDHDREAEIKAMSADLPARAATDYGLAGRPMKKDSRKMKGGLGRNFTNPSSVISLPVPESLRTSMSSGSERRALYKLKGLDLFSPRPTIRYSENPRYAPGASGWGSDDESKKRKLTSGPPIPEEVIRSKKRIEDLADDLDAGDLRELMERDQRRRERKKLSDQEKMRRKLARRAEKQEEAEKDAARNGTPPPKNMERGVIGRELVGLGIDPVTSTRRSSDASAKRRGKRPADLETDHPERSPDTPLSNFQRSESLAGSEGGSPIDEREEPIIGTALVARLSRASMSPPSSPKGHKRGASNISEMMELTKSPTPLPIAPVAPEQQLRLEPSRTDSEASGGKSRQHQSWMAFFKRNSKKKRNSVPSSFSNTSRESTVAATQIPYAYTAARAPASSGVPKRTMSKFREDLPENGLPISPPYSRVQSPETDILLPIQGPSAQRGGGRGSLDTPSPFGDQSRTRHDTPTSGYRSLEATRGRASTPVAINRSNISSPEPVAVMSQSLASIDSEGSWLSGRPRAGSKRSSGQMVPRSLRESASSLQKRHTDYDESAEELGIAEDEYFGRLTPGPDEHFRAHSKRRASGNPMPSSDEEDGGSLGSPGVKSKWGAVARKPKFIESNTRAKSREGTLNDFDNDSYSEGAGETPQDLQSRPSYEFESERNSDDATISRATSVNLGKGHVRHLSAGSAKLLDLKSRVSGETKRAT